MGSEAFKGSEARLPEFNTQMALEDIQTGLMDFMGGRGGKNLRAFQQALRNADPTLARRFDILKALGRTAEAGLQGLEDGGLPADVERGVMNRVRSQQAARGVIGSDFSALQEAAQLGLSAETFRQSRFNQAGMAANAIGGGFVSQFIPDANNLLQIPLAQFGADVNVRMGNAANRNARFGQWLQFGGDVGNAIAMA